MRASVAAPIVVDGRLWGVAIANWGGDEAPPARHRGADGAVRRTARHRDRQRRQPRPAHRVAGAPAHRGRRRAPARRARPARRRAAAAGAHDRHAEARAAGAPRGRRKAESLVAEALEHAEQGNAELRELAHGILPAVLTRGGLRAGVDAIVARLDLPVDVDVPSERFAAGDRGERVLHRGRGAHQRRQARARRPRRGHGVGRGRDAARRVRDDGIGGADPDGHGLVGIADRVTALGGRLEIESPPGGGTLLTAELPLSTG